MRKLFRTGVLVGSLLWASNAQAAKRYASVADILVASRCEVARLYKSLKAEGFHVSDFEGVVSIKAETSSVKSGSVEESAKPFGFLQIGGSLGGSTTFKESGTDTYNLFIIPNKAINERVCSNLWIRVVNAKFRPEKPIEWRVPEVIGPANNGQSNRTYVASLETDASSGLDLEINFLIFKIKIADKVDATDTQSFSFKFTFDIADNPNLSGGRALNIDRVPVVIGYPKKK